MPNGRPWGMFPILCMLRHPLSRQRAYYEREFCDGKLKMIKARGKFIKIWDNNGAKNLPKLHVQLGGWHLMRKRIDCVDLPPFERQIKSLAVTDKMMLVYRRTRSLILESYRKTAQEQRTNELGAQLVLAMRQAAATAKVSGVVDMAREFIANGSNPLIFCTYRAVAMHVAELLGVTPYMGDTSQTGRANILERFRGGKDACMVATWAAATGLNLTRANVLLLVDRPWTPGLVDQAESRAVRIGQERSVLSLWLTSFPIDRVVDKMLGDKQKRIGDVFSERKRTRVTNRTVDYWRVLRDSFDGDELFDGD
jgi:SNF2 family DNA or RNA helicase